MDLVTFTEEILNKNFFFCTVPWKTFSLVIHKRFLALNRRLMLNRVVASEHMNKTEHTSDIFMTFSRTISYFLQTCSLSHIFSGQPRDKITQKTWTHPVSCISESYIELKIKLNEHSKVWDNFWQLKAL